MPKYYRIEMDEFESLPFGPDMDEGGEGHAMVIEEGDIVKIDIPGLSLNVDISDEEMARRKENWQPREPKVTTGYLARYAKMVTSGNRGAILEK